LDFKSQEQGTDLTLVKEVGGRLMTPPPQLFGLCPSKR